MERYVHDAQETDATISRPVTERSRITGSERRTLGSGSRQLTHANTVDWGAVWASVLAGQAITATLIILGISTGLIAGNEDMSGEGALGILSGVGAWAVVAMLVGAFVGSLLGGRLARWLDRGSLAYHSLAAWGLSLLVSIVMVCLVTIAFASTATSAATTTAAAEQVTEGDATAGADNAAAGATAPAPADAQASEQQEQAADDTGDALGGAGVALTLGMLLSLLASFAGWWVGSRKRLTDFEREDDTRVAVS